MTTVLYDEAALGPSAASLQAVRSTYRALTDQEKARLALLKQMGARFLDFLERLRTPPEPGGEVDGVEMTVGTFDPSLDEARRKVQEAVFWASHHITG